MRAWRAIGSCVATAALVWSVSEAAETPSDEWIASEKVQLLDVPFIPQSEALCGGAALAMVLRFWGMQGVLAEDFAPLVEPELAGIRTGALVKAVEAYGWTALPLPGIPAEVESHLAQGRPVIALIRAGLNSYHYVVLVGWARGWVILHDPKVGPFRAVREGEFGVAFSGSGHWALLVLPPPGTEEPGVPDVAVSAPPSLGVLDGCGAMVEAGVLLAEQGDSAEAERKFLAAQSMWPASAAPLLERAGLRFRAEDWAGARRLAELALALDPSDAHGWRLLAGSCFLAGDVECALRAWNCLSEPRTDLTHIDGLTRIRYSAVTGQLDLPPGQILTPEAFRQASRRLGEIPAQSQSRLSLRPQPDGSVQVNVALLERPLLFTGPRDAVRAVINAFLEQEVVLDVASPSGNGELWTAGWRWWEKRPRISLALAIPANGPRPGTWRLKGIWERQTYAAQAPFGLSALTPLEVCREERRQTVLSYSDWFGPDHRLEIGAALDKWVGRGSYLSLEGSVETRWARDRLALGAQVARWVSLTSGAPFGSGGLTLKWCSSGLDRCDAWEGRLGISSTTSEAPLALWSGAGTGNGRTPFLRAHPLLKGGVVQGRVFGRTLLHGTIERQAWPCQLGPLQLGWILFVDGAKSWGTLQHDQIPWQVDGGTGLRLRGLGMEGQFRIDAAHGFEDGNSAISASWQIP